MPLLSRRTFVATAIAGATLPLSASTSSGQATQPADGSRSTGLEDRAYWLGVVNRLARPVLTSLSNGRLDADLRSRQGAPKQRADFAPLEALGRLLTGIAPWLESGSKTGEEGKMRTELAELARRGITAATDPASPAFMNFSRGGQPLVDAAFLAHAAIRAPGELWEKLGPAAQENLVKAMESTRVIKPGASNWLLFSAMVEAMLVRFGKTWKPEPIDVALKSHQAWYKGDGTYGDGAFFHWDYYNSFVIQPMLIDVLECVGKERQEWAAMRPEVLRRAARYAAVQERLISPEGTFPPIGRSLAYRFGAFQHLGQIALRRELPEPLKPAQVRCAMTAVIRRMTEAPGTFDADGFLTPGFCGRQPGIAEGYISPGSPYLCAAGLLPLGLSPDDPFWAAPAADWTSRLAWSGQDLPTDHAMSEKPH